MRSANFDDNYDEQTDFTIENIRVQAERAKQREIDAKMKKESMISNISPPKQRSGTFNSKKQSFGVNDISRGDLEPQGPEFNIAVPDLPHKYALDENNSTTISGLQEIFQQTMTAFQNCYRIQMANLEKHFEQELDKLHKDKMKLAENHKYSQEKVKTEFENLTKYR